MEDPEIDNEQDKLDKNTVSLELYVMIPKTRLEGLLAKDGILLQIYLKSSTFIY